MGDIQNILFAVRQIITRATYAQYWESSAADRQRSQGQKEAAEDILAEIYREYGYDNLRGKKKGKNKK